MKFKVDNKIATLKDAGGYRKWKQDIMMLLRANGVSYLAQPYTQSPPTQTNTSNTQTTTTSTTAPTQSSSSKEEKSSPLFDIEVESEVKVKKKVLEPSPVKVESTGGITVSRWEEENMTVVSQLYFYVGVVYQPIIQRLNPYTLPELFKQFDKLFINTDHMLAMAKREELQSFTFNIKQPLNPQIIKFEEIAMQVKELGGKISEDDLTYKFIQALPKPYKERINTHLYSPYAEFTYSAVKEAIITFYSRDSAWNTLPTQQSTDESQDKALSAKEKKKMEFKKKREEKKKEKEEKEKKEKEEKEKKEKQGKQDTSTLECYNCNEKGHKMWHCPHPLTLESRKKMDELRGRTWGGKTASFLALQPCISHPLPSSVVPVDSPMSDPAIKGPVCHYLMSLTP